MTLQEAVNQYGKFRDKTRVPELFGNTLHGRRVFDYEIIVSHENDAGVLLPIKNFCPVVGDKCDWKGEVVTVVEAEFTLEGLLQASLRPNVLN